MVYKLLLLVLEVESYYAVKTVLEFTMYPRLALNPYLSGVLKLRLSANSFLKINYLVCGSVGVCTSVVYV